MLSDNRAVSGWGSGWPTRSRALTKVLGLAVVHRPDVNAVRLFADLQSGLETALVDVELLLPAESIGEDARNERENECAHQQVVALGLNQQLLGVVLDALQMLHGRGGAAQLQRHRRNQRVAALAALLSAQSGDEPSSAACGAPRRRRCRTLASRTARAPRALPILLRQTCATSTRRVLTDVCAMLAQSAGELSCLMEA
jgi:hypothetical protein